MTDDITTWLHDEARWRDDPADLLTALAPKLSKAGLLLEAMTPEITTLHPLMADAVLAWHRSARTALETPRFHNPFGSDHASVIQALIVD